MPANEHYKLSWVIHNWSVIPKHYKLDIVLQATYFIVNLNCFYDDLIEKNQLSLSCLSWVKVINPLS